MSRLIDGSMLSQAAGGVDRYFNSLLGREQKGPAGAVQGQWRAGKRRATCAWGLPLLRRLALLVGLDVPAEESGPVGRDPGSAVAVGLGFALETAAEVFHFPGLHLRFLFVLRAGTEARDPLSTSPACSFLPQEDRINPNRAGKATWPRGSDQHFSR